jgi:hypothetical protein
LKNATTIELRTICRLALINAQCIVTREFNGNYVWSETDTR